MTYTMDSPPDSNVAQDDDSKRKDTTCGHKSDHVGLDSWVVTSTEYIRSARGLQSMRPVPDARKCLVDVLTDEFKTVF